MNLSKLIDWTRQALNNRDHDKARELLKEIDKRLNGRGNDETKKGRVLQTF